MPSKTIKAAKSVKTTKKVSNAAKPAAAKSRSKQAVLDLQNKRLRFVAAVFFTTAALISIAVGSGTYSASANSQTKMFLKALAVTPTEVGSTFNVALYENSDAQPVNAVQSAIQYPADSLQVVSVTTAKVFSQEAATDISTPGLIRIARSVEPKAPAVTGVKPVATVRFKVVQKPAIGSKLSIDHAASLLVRSTDNRNILQ